MLPRIQYARENWENEGTTELKVKLGTPAKFKLVPYAVVPKYYILN